MQFHHRGYVSGDPRIQPAAGTGRNRPTDLPGQVDVLIVGAGPAGMIAAAQLAQFADVTTRIVEARPGRLEVGQADGIQKRSVETFQAFGFADEIVAEGCEVTQTSFWKPDAADPSCIVRASREPEDTRGISEFPHILVNQARVLDYFARCMAQAPTRMQPDYGWRFEGLDLTEATDYPVAVHLKRSTGEHEGLPRTVRARYVVGADGAHSRVRRAINCTMTGDSSNHAWGVMDVLAVTDFPDVRTKCVIRSESAGNILLIPREGGYLVRFYVDLGEATPTIRQTTVAQTVTRAQAILRPYTLDVKHVAWYSVYEVGHRVCDRFDDVPVTAASQRTPRVFIAGDAAHTHSAKAGQGMNVSMQDGFNLAWKLGHVLQGRSPTGLLSTYSAERQVVGQQIIDFDKRWATMMATPPEQLDDPSSVEAAYVQITEFAQGFMTQYSPSLITGVPEHQHLATGFSIGKRFKSARVVRVADAKPLHLGHQARADGRWRIYVFAGPEPAGADSPTAALSRWLAQAAGSPLRLTPDALDEHAWFDLKIIYQQNFDAVDAGRVPPVYLPRVQPYGLIDYENIFAADPDDDIFECRGVSRCGAVVVVRPDQYIAHVLPLHAQQQLARFFGAFMLPPGRR